MRFPVFIPCLLIVLTAQIPLQGRAQNKQKLTPVDYQKVAFVDAARVRKEFITYEAAKEKMHQQTVEKSKAYEAATQELDKQTKEQLKKDSAQKLHQKQLITDKATVKRTELRNEFFAAIKKRNAERTALTKTYEDKIREAINTIVREGAFTEIKWSKDSAGPTLTDITDQVLQKLN
ncbi:MAG TPA: OmpH family outer membrane protein [Niastella sp.]